MTCTAQLGDTIVGMPGGQPDLQQLMQQAQKMQEELASAQAELAETEVTGTAGGGMVSATMTGAGEITSVTLDPSVVDPEDVETLQDLIVAALQAALEEQRSLTEEKMGPLADLGDMPGLPESGNA